MTVTALLDEVLSALNAADIPCMLTGSFASAVHGAGRATMDIDLVIDPTPEALQWFVGQMAAAGRYVSDEAAHEALVARTMFNVVDVETGWKIDLIIRKDRLFSREEFARRVDMPLGAVRLPVATLEDLVLAKLEWAKFGGSARQLEDVRALLELSGAALDRTYVERWARSLDVEAQWQSVRGVIAP
jgi:hypothetical protein